MIDQIKEEYMSNYEMTTKLNELIIAYNNQQKTIDSLRSNNSYLRQKLYDYEQRIEHLEERLL